MRVKIDGKKILTVMFVLYFVAEFLFAYTIVSRIMLLLFCGLCLMSCKKIYKNPFFVSYIFFVLWSLLSIWGGHAIAKNVAEDMTMTVALNCVFLFSFTQYCGLIKSPVEVLNLYKNICVLVSCFFCVFGFLGVLSGERLSVLGINANAIGVFAAYSLIIHIHGLFEKKRVSIEALLIFTLFVTVILFSGSRKAFIIPVIGWYVMLCFRKPKKIIKYSIIAVVVVITSVILILKVDFLYNIIGHRIESIFLFLQGMDYEESSLMTRNNFIQYAWECSQDSMIWGHGLDCFRTLPRAYGTYSHCNYLEILFSTGIVGVLIYYSTSIVTLVRGAKVLRGNKNVGLLLALLVSFLICDFFNVTYFTRRMIMIPSITIMFLRRYKNGDYR